LNEVTQVLYRNIRDVSNSGENRDFCTIREAAQQSGLAPKTWYQGGAGTNRIPRVRFGRSIRLLRKDVERFIEDRIAEAEQAVKSVEPSCNRT
jgi:hypothetical protein